MNETTGNPSSLWEPLFFFSIIDQNVINFFTLLRLPLDW